MQTDVSKYGKKMKSQMSRERSKEEHGEKEGSSKQAEPTRIKIFEGGYVKMADNHHFSLEGRPFEISMVAPLEQDSLL